MALTRLNNLISDRTGRMIYVNPDDFNASDLISNNGNSPTKPFKTLQRALLEVSKFSYVSGSGNDRYDQFTICLNPGDYTIDNRPGLATVSGLPVLSDQSNFNILDPNNDLYKFNSVTGGLIVPRGTSIVGMDLRKTRIRPRYVPDPTDSLLNNTSIFKVTGACYFWQFSVFDALPLSDSSGLGGAYKNSSNVLYDPSFSHHKVTSFVYADQQDLDLYYQKVAVGFADIPDTLGELSSTIQENRIVGPLSDIKQISAVEITDNTAMITTAGNHGVFKGQQITITGSIAPYAALNNTYNVISVDSLTTFKVSSVAIGGLTQGAVPSNVLTNSVVKAEIDTVDSSSPYIFNCSLRSIYGMCGLWADGAKVTGFKSMVVAQFTGVSLQKDDNAFIKFTETTSPNPDFVLNNGAPDAVTLHQDSSGYTFYREDWRNYHIRVSNGAFIQSVSVFAVGYAEQHLIESGGDYSLTNSNSNFGANALIADGFRSEAFSLDKKGYFTHIVPPQSLPSTETEVPYYALDVQKSKSSAFTKLHLFDQTDPNETPVFDVNQFKIGGRSGDKIYVKLVNPSTGLLQEYSSTITPNGIETHTISALDRAQNLFTVPDTHNFETGTPIRFYSSNGYLPYGMDPGRIYYAIRISNSRFKISPTEEDARAGAGGAQNSIVDIRSQIPSGATLTVKAFVGDTNPSLPAFNITSVSPNLETFSTGTFTHGFTTGDTIFFRPSIENATLPTITGGSLSLSTEYFVIVVDAFTFKIAANESDANGGIAINILTPGTSNSLKVYKNVQKSPLRYDPALNNWYVNVDPGITNQIHQILINPSAIYANPLVVTTENSYFKRISDDRTNQDRIYRLRYVIPKTVTEARPPLLGYVIKRRTDENNQIITHEIATNANNVTSNNNDFERVYYIYKVDTLLKQIPNEQDGVYYLTILLADITPKGVQFSSQTNWFAYLKYSQDSANLYPLLDKDNPVANPTAAISVADNLVHGFVYQNDEGRSITREAVETFLSETGYSPILSSLDGKAVSGREDRLIAFSGAIPSINIELRRTSQIRAGNQTFEYTGFSSGNYSAAFPSVQKRILTDKEILYSQAQRRRGGIVFYSGLNAYGDLYVGNQKINAVTGEVEILDKPILKVSATTGVAEAAENVEFVPYVSGTKNVSIDGSISTQGGPSKIPNTFNNNSIFNEGVKIARQAPSTINRALVTHDVVYRPKTTPIDSNPLNGNIKQTVLWDLNNTPTPSVEGIYNGDLYYKPFISSNTRNQSWIYTGQNINNGWAQTGLIGTGHLTAIEETYSGSNDPYTVTGKFGINKSAPSAELHVGGSGIFDNDLAVNGGDITSGSSTFNLVNTPTTITFGASATSLTIGANSGILTLRNPNIRSAEATVNLFTTTPNITVGSFDAGGTVTINNPNLKLKSTSISVDGNKIVLNDITIPNTASATGGGIVLKGPVFVSGDPVDKKITWAALANPSNPNELWSTWVSNCRFNLESGLTYNINGIPVLSSTTLGAGVTFSNLTTVGNITNGTWNGSTIALNRGGTGATTQPEAANNILPPQSGRGPINTSFLTTDGTNVSWGTVPTPTIDQVLGSGNSTSRTLTIGGLTVNGTISATGTISTTSNLSCGGTLTVGGSINANGDITAFAASDRRLKDNIVPISNALQKVSIISGNTYTWNENSEYAGQSDVGVIAQEIASVLPEATTVRDNGYMAVRYEKIVPLLIEAIKDLKTEVDTLKAKLAE